MKLEGARGWFGANLVLVAADHGAVEALGSARGRVDDRLHRRGVVGVSASHDDGEFTSLRVSCKGLMVRPDDSCGCVVVSQCALAEISKGEVGGVKVWFAWLGLLPICSQKQGALASSQLPTSNQLSRRIDNGVT